MSRRVVMPVDAGLLGQMIRLPVGVTIEGARHRIENGFVLVELLLQCAEFPETSEMTTVTPVITRTAERLEWDFRNGVVLSS